MVKLLFWLLFIFVSLSNTSKMFWLFDCLIVLQCSLSFYFFYFALLFSRSIECILLHTHKIWTLEHAYENIFIFMDFLFNIKFYWKYYSFETTEINYALFSACSLIISNFETIRWYPLNLESTIECCICTTLSFIRDKL